MFHEDRRHVSSVTWSYLSVYGYFIEPQIEPFFPDITLSYDLSNSVTSDFLIYVLK